MFNTKSFKVIINTGTAIFVISMVAFFASLTIIKVAKEIGDIEKSISYSTLLQNAKILSIGEAKIQIEVADTDEKRSLGLSGRAVLRQNHGMLFVFDEPGLYSFWMKDMHFPLDIVWIDEQYTVVAVTENISPESFPNSFVPNTPIQYVLEVNAGFTKTHGLGIGNRVFF